MNGKLMWLMRDNNQDPVFQYARKEFSRLFSLVFDGTVAEADIREPGAEETAVLTVDASLWEQEIRIEADPGYVSIGAGSPAAVLHAVYAFFEQMGCIFEFSGENLPPRSAGRRIPHLRLRHIPSVRERGIRMHLNFVQDQSFFTREAFEEFIDNMARQKFNYLCFHMYTPQQWFPFSYRGVPHLGQQLGNLDRKPISGAMPGREKVKVGNHWFPAEFEAIEEPAELLDAVYGRYRDMMVRSRARGIAVSVSMEPESLPEAFEEMLPHWSGESRQPADSEKRLAESWQEGWSGKKLFKADLRHPLMVDIGVERCLQCIDAFPDMDEIQLISREGTAWHPEGEDSFRQELNRLADKFRLEGGLPEESAMGRVVPENEGPKMNPKAHPYWTVLPGDNYYATVIGSLRFVEFALEILSDARVREKIASRKLKSSIAVYSPNPGTVELILPSISGMLPEGTRFHLLADYGARDIARRMDSWSPLTRQGHQTGLISWLEFDGCMMLAQNWMESLELNIGKALEHGIQTMYFNHWRVRSLEHNAAAASALCWDARTGIGGFYRKYFTSLYGEASVQLAQQAYEQLEKATVYAKDKNYNIGFTKDWVFRHSTDVPGYYWATLLESENNYRKASGAFSVLAAECSPRGRAQASYLAELCRISALHIRAVYHLQNAKLPLMGYLAWPTDNPHAAWPPPDKLKLLVQDAEKALELEREYMEVYAGWVSGCDEQGQLVMHQQGVIEPLEEFVADLRKQLGIEEAKYEKFTTAAIEEP